MSEVVNVDAITAVRALIKDEPRTPYNDREYLYRADRKASH